MTHAGNGANCLSPTLLAPARAAAYELKFLVSVVEAEEVEAWARDQLVLDPHADPDLGNAYRVHSVYFDTDRLDVYHRAPSFRRRKFRLRRYGNERVVYLERKSKSGDRVRKRRSSVLDHELELLEESTCDPAWGGHWFHRRLRGRLLRPRCLVSYCRSAYVADFGDGPVRLTLDRNVMCAVTRKLAFEDSTPNVPILSHSVILELKFSIALPLLFKRLVQERGLNANGVSKYRLSIQACNLATDGMAEASDSDSSAVPGTSTIIAADPGVI